MINLIFNFLTFIKNIELIYFQLSNLNVENLTLIMELVLTPVVSSDLKRVILLNGVCNLKFLE